MEEFALKEFPFDNFNDLIGANALKLFEGNLAKTHLIVDVDLFLRSML
tara:strand:- start:1212 stop:1355 length:144 start_codon:yes stop_codon:yes gene_type:complete